MKYNDISILLNLVNGHQTVAHYLFFILLLHYITDFVSLVIKIFNCITFAYVNFPHLVIAEIILLLQLHHPQSYYLLYQEFLDFIDMLVTFFFNFSLKVHHKEVHI